jgi:hypothetical protein
MRRGILGLTALGILIAALSGVRTGPTVASAAVGPTPVALQYDEIVRIVIPTATPPPPGSFLADYQAIVGNAGSQSASDQGASAATPTPAPHRGGLGGLIGSVLSGSAPSGGGNQSGGNPYAGAMNSMQNMMSGHLVRYAYYHNWIRTDDVVGQTATISKCDVHQFITLDLAHHTYTMSDTTPKSCPSNVPMMGGYQGGSQQQQQAPGTADMTISGTATNLGPLTIDGIPTTGSSRSLSMNTTNATGSCKDNSMSMQMEQYVSQIVPPRPYCPITHSGVPQSPAEAVSSGGCKPRMHVDGAGVGAGFGDSGRQLVMYLRMNMQGGSGGGGMSMVTQRGNVKWLYTPQAEALFSVPPGFTQTQ